MNCGTANVMDKPNPHKKCKKCNKPLYITPMTYLFYPPPVPPTNPPDPNPQPTP